jgi:hypothetical protein
MCRYVCVRVSRHACLLDLSPWPYGVVKKVRYFSAVCKTQLCAKHVLSCVQDMQERLAFYAPLESFYGYVCAGKL